MVGLLDLVRVSSMELPVLLLTYLTLVSPLPKDRAVNLPSRSFLTYAYGWFVKQGPLN